MKLKRFYGLYFTLGCLFLFDPVVKLFDVLPNAVGYLLIATSLKEISALEYRIENSQRLLYYGMAISGVRFALMFSTFTMNTSDMLTAVTVLGLAELFVIIYFFISFFSGFTYLAQRSESENILGNIDSVRSLSIIFAIAHTAATILPELTALLEIALDHDPDSYPMLSLGRLNLYKNYAIVICLLISLIVGIWWLKETLSFMKGVKKDKLFRASVEKRYGEYVGDTPYEELFIKTKSALVLLLAGGLFSMNLRVYDEVALHHNLIIPAWVGTLLFAFAAWRLGAKATGLVSYAAFGLIQFALGHILDYDNWLSVGQAVIPLTVLCVAVSADIRLKKQLLLFLDVDIKTELLRQHIPLLLYALLSVAYEITEISLLHSFKVLCFIAWIGFAAWTYSAVNEEINLRRKTH